MKKMISKMATAGLLIAGLSLFSFDRLPGGDSFQVYLNGKLVLDKALYKSKEIQNLELVQASANDKVEIYYSHCGQKGTDRAITAKDEDQKVLKTWRFADDGKYMSIQLSELNSLQANNKTDKIGLYYSSKELSAGQQLVLVTMGNKSVVAR